VGLLHGGSGEGLAARACPIPGRNRAAGGHEGSPSPGHWAPPWGWGLAKAQLGSAHGWAGQGCGEQETGPAAALLGQGQTALGG